MLLPGLCVAALVGGAGGYQWAKRWGKQELQRHRVAVDAGPDCDPPLQNPTFRRLKYLVKWGHWQLLEYEDSPPEWRCAVLDEVIMSFSPWVQKMYLLRARGCASESNTEAWEVFLHLAPLYYLLQRRAAVEATMEAVKAVTAAFDTGVMEPYCAGRLSVSFPTILETISITDRLSPATHEQLCKETSASKRRGVHSENRANRRHRLQRIVDVIRQVLERTDVRQALADRRLLEPRHEADGSGEAAAVANSAPPGAASMPDSPASSHRSSRVQVQLVLPPEGAEDEHGGAGGSDVDPQYYSVSEESDEAAEPSSPIRRSPPQRSASISASADGAGTANFKKRLEAFPRGEGDHMWMNFDAGQFDVRSDSYLFDKRKNPSEPSLFELVSVDFQLVGPGGPVWRATEHEDFYPAHHRRKKDKRFLLVQNWVFPPFQCVLTGALDPAAPWLRGGPSGTPQARLWHKFLEMDDEGRRDVFKVICSVEDGPWLVKRALPKKPVLIGRKLGMCTFHQPDDYLEIVFDVASGRGQQVAVGIVCGALRRLQLAFSALIEAREDDELPENILFCASMLHLDPAKLFSPEVT